MNRMQAILSVNLVLAAPAWTELAQAQAQGSELITKVYEIKWRKAEDLASLLEGFADTAVNPEQLANRLQLIKKLPTAKGVAMLMEGNEAVPSPLKGVNSAFNTITVSATSDQHLIFQELIRKYDTPPKRVVFEFYILSATREGEGTRNGLPAPIREVLEDISSLTMYRQFEVLGSPVITVSEGGGNPRSLKTKGQFALEIDGIRVVPAEDRKSIVVDRFQFGAADKKIDEKDLLKMLAINRRHAGLSAYSAASVVTPFVAASGETLVIGTSHVSDPSEIGDAVIIVVTPTVLD